MKKILFLSALDFKEKSIQVIKKTPEAYAKNGWHVDYLVARDNAPNGNYFYEREINPNQINIQRFYWPFAKTRASLPRYLSLLLTKIASFLVIIKLFSRGYSLNKKNKYDVIYGYELQGVLAMHLLRPFLKKNQKTVSRFQGTFLNEMFNKKQYARLFFNLDLILAIWLKSNTIIMTNDGTQGNLAINRIRKKTNTLFITNGVDAITKLNIQERTSETVFITVSRLVHWKRVDRCIKTFAAFLKQSKKNAKLYVVGEGSEKENLKQLVDSLNISKNVFFCGAINNQDVANKLVKADVFLSMYESSNVGNPLLEAIRANLLVVTLDNGDTSNWISHKKTGLIYDEKNIDYLLIAKDIQNILNNPIILANIQKNLSAFEKANLFTWDHRFEIEINHLNSL